VETVKFNSVVRHWKSIRIPANLSNEMQAFSQRRIALLLVLRLV